MIANFLARISDISSKCIQSFLLFNQIQICFQQFSSDFIFVFVKVSNNFSYCILCFFDNLIFFLLKSLCSLPASSPFHFSKFLVSCSSIIIGEYFSIVEISDIPKGVASILFSRIYPRS